MSGTFHQIGSVILALMVIRALAIMVLPTSTIISYFSDLLVGLGMRCSFSFTAPFIGGKVGAFYTTCIV